MVVLATDLRLDTNWVDYLLIAVYFVFVLGIGVMARRAVSSSLDFFLSGRSLPAWVTGLAFISANLGAVEVMGLSANGAQYGLPTVHYFWIGAIPAMSTRLAPISERRATRPRSTLPGVRTRRRTRVARPSRSPLSWVPPWVFPRAR